MSTKFAHIYSNKRWQYLRIKQLDKQPLCAICTALGYVELATIVDHITPHKGDEKLAYDPKNLQSLCKQCHDSTKQVIENGGVPVMHGVDGLPLSPDHPWNVEKEPA